MFCALILHAGIFVLFQYGLPFTIEDMPEFMGPLAVVIELPLEPVSTEVEIETEIVETEPALEGATVLTTEAEPPRPQISYVSPSPGAKNVPVDTNISVPFSMLMDMTSAEGAFSIMPSVKGTFTWEGNTMIFDPIDKLWFKLRTPLVVTLKP